MPQALARKGVYIATILAFGTSTAVSQPPAPPRKVPLASLTAQGFEIKATTGNQAGTVGMLVLQKDKDVFLCSSRDLSIDPTSFECWQVK
jgi:hypothetical protein